MTTFTGTGTIDNPDPTYTHTEPASPIALQTVQPGTSPQVPLGSFHNTGNVTQTVLVNNFNVQNATLDDVVFHMNGVVVNDSPTAATVTLQPDEVADLAINITVPPAAPGADTSYSVSFDSTWS